MRKEYSKKELLPGIFLIYGFQEECCIYAVVGTDSVALIDTGMGTGNLHTVLHEIAPEKPVTVFNTHCHFDHSAGNSQFPQVYMHPLCYPDQDETENMPLPKEIVYEDNPLFVCQRNPVYEGTCFTLGGKTLEIIETPGHTPGCICLLDKEDRVLFAGDLIGSDRHCVHMLDHLEFLKFSTVSIETYLRSLQKIKSIENQFDFILAGHDVELLSKTYLDELIRMSSEILSNTDKRYHPNLPSAYGNTICWRVDGKNTAILFQDESIFDA